MKTPWALLVLLFPVVIGASLLAWRAIGSEEQAVYSAVVERAASGKIEMTAVAVSHPSDCEAGTEIDGIPPALLAAFQKANGPTARPVRLYALEGRVPVVAWETNQRFFAQPRLLLGKMDGRSLLALSRVGIADDGETALLCVESLGSSYSEGNLALFVKTDRGWVLSTMVPTWLT